jgi:hypothetical protein
MDRYTYNVLRDWELPANENGDDPGYLVEYVDGGKPNVEGFTGYISWSPKDVFECAYTLGAEPRPTTFLDRLKVEALELGEKWVKLKTFIQSPEYQALPERERLDLVKQSSAMEDYHWILSRRIGRAEAGPATSAAA